MAESAQSGSDAIGADAAAGAAGGCGGGGAPGRAAHPDCGTAVELRDAGPLIVATVRLADCDPWRAMAAFTDPVVLSRWWRGELIADLVAGGEYSVSFPAIPARLAGRVPPRRYASASSPPATGGP